jgi:hypothetical protein
MNAAAETLLLPLPVLPLSPTQHLPPRAIKKSSSSFKCFQLLNELVPDMGEISLKM